MALKQITIDYWKDQGIKKLQRRIKSVQNKIEKKTAKMYERTKNPYSQKTAGYWSAWNSLRVETETLKDLLEVEKVLLVKFEKGDTVQIINEHQPETYVIQSIKGDKAVLTWFGELHCIEELKNLKRINE